MSSITPTVVPQALIFKLFDELLEGIFLNLTPSWSSAGYYVGPTKLARAISQVCSRWRKLSLEIPGLWQSIELEHRTQEWTEELLRRSARAPFIEIQSTDIKSFDNILYFPGILPRIRFFQRSLSAIGWVHLFNGAQLPGGQLEHLSLDHRSEVEYQRTGVTFHGHTPPLRYMRMPKTDDMHLAAPFFSNLRDVNISQPQLSIPYLASVANSMVFLERLKVTAELIIENEHPHPQIHFPHLQYLDYADQNFLKYVDVPQECTLRATCSWEDCTEAITNITRRLIHTHTNKGNSWLAFYISNSHFRINNHHNMFPSNNPSDELFVYTGKRGQTRWRILLDYLIPYLAVILPTITSLRFESSAEMGWEDIGSFFCHFTAVRTICFGFSDENLVFPCLKQLYGHGSGLRILFPSLKTFRLPHNYHWRRNTAAQFKSYLGWRIEQNSPIESIEGQYDVEYDFGPDWGSFRSELESTYGVRVKGEYPYFSCYDQSLPFD